MSRVHPEDRGLAAVQRVREVREQDSRVGLQQALAEERALEQRLDSYHERLSHTEIPQVATPSELVSLQVLLQMLGTTICETRAETATAVALAADARARWAADKARVAAVEHLLERRAEARRVEADRRTASTLDDLAAQGWRRASTQDREQHLA